MGCLREGVIFAAISNRFLWGSFAFAPTKSGCCDIVRSTSGFVRAGAQGMPGTAVFRTMRACDPAGHHRRSFVAQEMVVDGDHFPAGADGRTIHRVNPVGGAVRCLSVAPTTAEEILSVSHGALSKVLATRIERDLRPEDRAAGEGPDPGRHPGGRGSDGD